MWLEEKNNHFKNNIHSLAKNTDFNNEIQIQKQLK